MFYSPRIYVKSAPLSEHFFDKVVCQPVKSTEVHFAYIAIFKLVVYVFCLFKYVNAFQQQRFNVFFIKAQLAVIFAQNIFIAILICGNMLCALNIYRECVAGGHISKAFFGNQNVRGLFGEQYISADYDVVSDRSRIIGNVCKQLFGYSRFVAYNGYVVGEIFNCICKCYKPFRVTPERKRFSIFPFLSETGSNCKRISPVSS